MSILAIVIAIVVAGLVLYLVNKFVPMEQNIKNILNWVVIIALIIWLMKVFGVWAYLSEVTV